MYSYLDAWKAFSEHAKVTSIATATNSNRMILFIQALERLNTFSLNDQCPRAFAKSSPRSNESQPLVDLPFHVVKACSR